MRTAEDAAVNEALEEAGEDLIDAEALARRAGGTSMSLYHAAQAAGKYLGALAVAADRTVNPMWDLPRVFDAVKDLDGMDAVAEHVEMLTEFATPARRTGTSVGPGMALRALRQIRREVLVRLGVDVPPEPEPASATPPAKTTVAAPATAAAPETESETAPDEGPSPAAIGRALPAEDEEIDRAVVADAPEPEREFPGVLPEAAWGAETGSMSPKRTTGRGGVPAAGRGDGERRTSYVKVFLMCAQCGVRIPRTRQTAQGRVPCPHCGRPMQPVQ